MRRIGCTAMELSHVKEVMIAGLFARGLFMRKQRAEECTQAPSADERPILCWHNLAGREGHGLALVSLSQRSGSSFRGREAGSAGLTTRFRDRSLVAFAPPCQ